MYKNAFGPNQERAFDIAPHGLIAKAVHLGLI